MSYHKRRIRGKIGTTSSKIIVLWGNPKLEKGAKILAMEENTYNQIPSQYRRLKSCNDWTWYRVDDINPDGFVFLSL